MRLDRAFRMKRMLPAPKTTTANGQTVSAASYGSGGHATKGILDTQGWGRVRIEVSKSGGTAQKLSKIKFGMQSGATTLFASCTPLSGYTSGVLLSGITTSAVAYAYDINLRAYRSRKRYLNCQLITSTTSGNVEVRAFLSEPEQFPVADASNGYVSITNIY